MNCLKCGREMEENNAFCSDCLNEMAKHPVNPNTVVVLPSHRRAPVRKTVPSRRRAPSQQELLRKYRRRCRRLAIATAVLTLLLAAAIGLSAWLYSRQKAPPRGQNYTAIPSAVNSQAEESGT